MRSLLKTVVALISGLLLLLLAWNDGVVMAEEPPQMSSMFVLTGGAVFYNHDTNKLPHFNDGGDFQIKDVLVGGTKILSIGAGLFERSFSSFLFLLFSSYLYLLFELNNPSWHI